MKEVYECLGKTISVGEKWKFKAFESNVDSDRAFIQDQIEKMQLLINNFGTHIDVLKNGYKSDSKNLRHLCL